MDFWRQQQQQQFVSGQNNPGNPANPSLNDVLAVYNSGYVPQQYDPATRPQQPPPLNLYGMNLNGLDAGALNSAFPLQFAQNLAQLGWGGQSVAQNGGGNMYGGEFSGQRGPAMRGQNARRNNNNNNYNNKGRGPRNSNSKVSEATIDTILRRIRSAGRHQPTSEVISEFLSQIDGRALASVMKSLANSNMIFRAIDIFEHLRRAPQGSEGYQLLDVYSYTAAISLCVNKKELERALQLFEEMRSRDVEKNVHTYTALMNVCIKCSQMQKALDLYQEMLDANIALNVVSYNTVIDAYGKLGRYEEALKVFERMKKAGVKAVTRTYNTLMIACNSSGYQNEALRVYEQMLADGHQPNTTTYNALITSHSKAGDLNKVMDTYQLMCSTGVERSVITYSSLINACEKAGHWEMALKIYGEMLADGCEPNVITFNSLITACAQGGQCQKATEVYNQMCARGVGPDVVTFTALIRAHEKAGQGRQALEAFIQMRRQGIKADPIVYHAIMEVLWDTGVTWMRNKSVALFRHGLTEVLQKTYFESGPSLKLTVNTFSAPLAMVTLMAWFAELREKSVNNKEGLSGEVVLVFGKGRNSKDYNEVISKESIIARLKHLGAPFKPQANGAGGDILFASGEEVTSWLNDATVRDIVSIRTNIDSCENELFEDEKVEGNCLASMVEVQRFESSHRLNLPMMGNSNYLQLRSSTVETCRSLAHTLGMLSDDQFYDGILLMDRLMSTGTVLGEQETMLSMLLCMVMVNKSSSSIPIWQHEQAIGNAVGVSPEVIKQLEMEILHRLENDTESICALRSAKIYLQRLGDNNENTLQVVRDAMCCLDFMNFRPSVLAAGMVIVQRMREGQVPYWPSTLKTISGYVESNNLELTACLQATRKWFSMGSTGPLLSPTPSTSSHLPNANMMYASSNSIANTTVNTNTNTNTTNNMYSSGGSNAGNYTGMSGSGSSSNAGSLASTPHMQHAASSNSM